VGMSKTRGRKDTQGPVIYPTYWWCCDVKQEQICRELNIVSHTAVDWNSFCHETCEVTRLGREEKVGDPGKVVQIDESKFGKIPQRASG
jgi:hypothetical protein